MQHRGFLRLAALPAIVAGALLAQASPGYAERGTTIVLTDPLFVTNPCVPELVTLTGTMRLTTFAGDANGAPDIVIRDHASHLVGFGALTGSMYVVNQSDHFNLDTQHSGTTVTTTLAHLDIRSLGTAPTFMMHTTIHLTINAKGKPTASVFKIHTTCKEPNGGHLMKPSVTTQLSSAAEALTQAPAPGGNAQATAHATINPAGMPTTSVPSLAPASPPDTRGHQGKRK